jgi:hypothetical protein
MREHFHHLASAWLCSRERFLIKVSSSHGWGSPNCQDSAARDSSNVSGMKQPMQAPFTPPVDELNEICRASTAFSSMNSPREWPGNSSHATRAIASASVYRCSSNAILKDSTSRSRRCSRACHHAYPDRTRQASVVRISSDCRLHCHQRNFLFRVKAISVTRFACTPKSALATNSSRPAADLRDFPGCRGRGTARSSGRLASLFSRPGARSPADRGGRAARG